jgi:hypothetical protein
MRMWPCVLRFHVPNNNSLTLSDIYSSSALSTTRSHFLVNFDNHELGGLRLALEQAAAHIKSIKCSFEDYIKRFQKKRLKLLKTATQSAAICKDRLTVNIRMAFRRMMCLSSLSMESLMTSWTSLCTDNEFPRVDWNKENLVKISITCFKPTSSSQQMQLF